MARMKHFPTINKEYIKWVLKQNPEMVLGTAFTGVRTPYETYLSEYYGSKVMVVAGDCYLLNDKKYDLPDEWTEFTVDYHESDMRDVWEEADGPESGLEVTTAQEIAYLREWYGVELVPVQKFEQGPEELIKAATIAVATDKQTGAILGFAVRSNTTEDFHQVQYIQEEDKPLEFTCDCLAAEFNFHNCQRYGHCCHIEAVIQVLEARNALEEQRAVVEAERHLAAEYVAQEEKKLMQTVERAILASQRSNRFDIGKIVTMTGLTPEQVYEAIHLLKESGSEIERAGWAGAFLIHMTQEQLVRYRAMRSTRDVQWTQGPSGGNVPM